MLHLIAGARPNFMKIAPLAEALRAAQQRGSSLAFQIIHTGQHYDRNMSAQFFEELGIPEPEVNLGAGGGTQAEQTARIMVAYEALLSRAPCDLCIVVGDVNSTLACSITAKKMGVPVAHVEAGIRSYDLSMPEEINRMVTDSITDYFFTTTEQAGNNLLHLGAPADRVFFVGNTMIDTLLKQRPRFRPPACWGQFGLAPGGYLVMTLHRPSNVDDPDKLLALLRAVSDHSQGLPVVFPVHPRTRRALEQLPFRDTALKITDPLGYLEFNYLVEHAKAVITDSGGVTEETTVMGVPCMTLRTSTERPETVDLGTNELLGDGPLAIPSAMERLFSGQWKRGTIPPLWDGKAAERIVEVLEKILNEGR
jgi:UDP-N-acetylglucosamine 2-epimerase (non-hydrolysing)